MKRASSSVPPRSSLFIEALEPRIAPAGLLNESKFTSVVVGGSVLLDASGGATDFQGLSTAFGANAGSYLLYITTGKALVYTTDINGNGRLDPGEITGISAGTDSQGRPMNITLFSDVHGDIATNLLPGRGVSALTDSDNNPTNGRDGRVLLNNDIGSITLRTLTAADIDQTIPGNTLANRLALTSFSIYGNVISGRNFGVATTGSGTIGTAPVGLTIDTSGAPLLGAVFNFGSNNQVYTGSLPTVGGIYTGSAASNLAFHFTQNRDNNIAGTFVPFAAPNGQPGGDITGVQAANNNMTYSVGTLHTGAGGFGARGGNISNITFNGAVGGYEVIAGDGGQGATGGVGGSIANFAELGTFVGTAVLHSGGGGEGLLGAGGAGGTATFGTLNAAANVQVLLGAGGAGFNQGGNGSGLPSSAFTAPDVTVTVGTSVLGTWHDIGDIGRTQFTGLDGNGNPTYRPHVIDFDGDGIGDAVFTTTSPNQITVVFGDGGGNLFDNGGTYTKDTFSKTVILKTPGIANPVITVGDFNGDGKPDIAAGSGSASSFGGVYIFLNQTNNATLNPVNASNYTRNPLGDNPFSNALQTALPTLPDFGTFTTSGGVLALATGDFNGDGITDLAYVQRVSFVTLPVTTGNVVGVLFGSAATDTTGAPLTNPSGRPQGSGFFYANSAAPRATPTLQIAFDARGGTLPILEATSLSTAGGPEAFFYGTVGADGPTVFQPTGVANGNTRPTGLGLTTLASLPLGQVDTNRLLPAGGPNISLAKATLQDFTVMDFDGDGLADVVDMSNAPIQFLVNFRGTDGFGGFAKTTREGQNAGVFLGVGVTVPPQSTVLIAVDTNQDGRFAEVGLLRILTDPVSAQIREVSFPDSDINEAQQVRTPFSFPFLVGDLPVAGLDAYYIDAISARPVTGFIGFQPNNSNYQTTGLFLFNAAISTGFVGFRPLTENGYTVFAGNGGNSTAGGGGNGGVLGTSLTGALGSISVLFPSSPEYTGSVSLLGGDGGNGFTSGGIGSDIRGVSARYLNAGVLTSQVIISAGNGGNGVSGDGGRGGSLSSLTIDTGVRFDAGNGGNGVRGGAGGFIQGNGAGLFDTRNNGVSVISGFGGQGSLAGGAGGAITNWLSQFPPVVAGLISGQGGDLLYVAGAGGNAAAGNGGNGGGIINSSPDNSVNNISGDLTLLTGAGGNGLFGGSGGNLTTFINQPTASTAVPAALTVISGAGGIGVAGAGGNGGTISNFRSNATGLVFDFNNPGALNGLARVIAGNGGASYGGAGGTGGAVTQTTATATSTPILVAAGAGGVGLTAGGTGGNVANVFANSAAQQIGKVLVVAGAGGDALAAQLTDISSAGDIARAILAFGGVSGVGGNGGNITNFTQPISTQTAVDLVAGNGGSTLGYGNALTPTPGVGRGGSVDVIALTGTVGSISRNLNQGQATNPPIVAYTRPDLGITTSSTITDFVNSVIDPSDPNNASFTLLDNVGNVGIVAGISGQVRGGQPAVNGVNGSVTNVTASSIMSIVAGSVNSVAPVQTLSNIRVTNIDGVLGADKGGTNADGTPGAPNGRLDYIDLNGNLVQNLQAGYRLVDGALFALNRIQPGTPPFLIGPRIFSPQNT